MRYFLLLILFSKCGLSAAQVRLDTTGETDFGLSTYLFAYPHAANAKLNANSGSLATGPSAFFFNNKRTGLQLGVLFDLKGYTYEDWSQVSPMQGKVIISTRRNLFFPMSVIYRLYTNRKINFFLMAGVILGGRNWSDNTNYTHEGTPINLIAGACISWTVNKRFSMRISPTFKFPLMDSPGMLIDFYIRSKHS